MLFSCFYLTNQIKSLEAVLSVTFAFWSCSLYRNSQIEVHKVVYAIKGGNIRLNPKTQSERLQKHWDWPIQRSGTFLKRRNTMANAATA